MIINVEIRTYYCLIICVMTQYLAICSYFQFGFKARRKVHYATLKLFVLVDTVIFVLIYYLVSVLVLVLIISSFNQIMTNPPTG